MKEKTCCFTGHRALSDAALCHLQKRLDAEIIRLINQGVLYFGAGGARGFDMLASCAVLRLRAHYPQIRLILVLPCQDQTKGDISSYQYILAHADKVIYTATSYFDGCMQLRNRHLVDNSGHCICYLCERTGGTAYTVQYAREQGLSIVNLCD